MRKPIIMLMMACCLAANAKTKHVKVATMKGTVYVGVLKEFKVFEQVIVTVEGKDVVIPYKDMAYIDEIMPDISEPVKVEPEPVKVESKPVNFEAIDTEKEDVVAPAVKTGVELSAASESSKLKDYKGLVLEKSNSVYLDCISDPKDDAYNEAAHDVLKRQLRRDGFWKVVDNPSEAHFSIVCLVSLETKGKASVAICSLLTDKNEWLGAEKGAGDVNEYRKIVWELYNKYILSLQKKIESNKIPKQTKKDFTVD